MLNKTDLSAFDKTKCNFHQSKTHLSKAKVTFRSSKTNRGSFSGQSLFEIYNCIEKVN